MKTANLLLLNVLCISALFAKPEGFHLKAGEAAPPISEKADSLTIASRGNAIIEWESFCIERQELVQFLQDGPSSCVLNRVTGPLQSSIMGALQSNGKVLLINPQGILVGENARIDTAGFTASTLDVLDADFLKGSELLFFGESPGAVVNYGTIHCLNGDIVLLGRTVRNGGALEADGVALSAGVEILVKPDDAERVFIRAGHAEGAVEHTGLIQALTVELKASANPYAKAVQSAGTIEAQHMGEITFEAGEGVCEVSGQVTAPAGRVHVLGRDVHLLAGAEIDVSGNEGGGTILVGGDFQGKNPAIANAKRVWVAPKQK